MINHHGILKQELKKIGNNVNKKYGTLRKQVNKTCEVFQNSNLPIFPYEVCFGLFKVLTQAASVQSTLLFFPFFQQLINLGFANEDMSRQILTILTQLRSLPKFQGIENQSKLQQMLSLLISKQLIVLERLNFTHSLINVLFSLDNLHNKVLRSKTINILGQIIGLCINSLQNNSNSQNRVLLSTFFNDLVNIVKSQPPKWYIEIPDPFAILSIYTQILDNKYIIENKTYWQEIFYKLLPTIRKMLIKISQNNTIGSQTNIKNWQLPAEQKAIIILQVACKFSKLYFKGFEIIQDIIKVFNEKSNPHFKILAYKSIDFLFSDYHWMQKLLESNYAELYNFLLTTQFNTLKSLASNQQKQKIDLMLNQIDFPKIFNGSIQFTKVQFSSSSEVKMIIRNVEEISNSLYGIYNQSFNLSTGVKINQQPPMFKTFKFTQKTIFQILKVVLLKDMNEEMLQSILKTAEKFINLGGSFGDNNVSTMYMKLVCKYCLPADAKAIQYRHVLINKMILNTVNCLGSLLNIGCWVIVWKALQNYSLYYNRYLLSKHNQQPQRQTDVQILYKTMDSIFTESPKYGDQYLLTILQSLVQVTYQCLENNYSQQTKKIFSFQRIEQIYRLNLHRIPLIWPSLSSSLLCITTSKVSYFRISALNLLNTLIPLSLHYMNTHHNKMALTFNLDNYENLILQPWMNLVLCQFQQLRNQLVLAVNKLIIDYGHILTHGWKNILYVVSQMNDLKSLQAIVQTFLDKVNDHIQQILLIVDNIERKLPDTNQKYLCLTLIWAIGDHSHKHNHPKILRKIYNILLQPEQMFNLGTEARHSSFYIFTELIVHNCLENTVQFWSQVFQQIEQFCTFGVNQSLQSQDKKLAQQALKNIMINLIKVYRIFFMVAQQWPDKSFVSEKLKFFYKLCANILKFRKSQVIQTLIKQLKQILLAKPNESHQTEQLLHFFQAVTQTYIVDPDNKILKCLITYLPADIYQIIVCSLPLTQNQKSFGIIYKLVEKIFLLRLEAEEKDIKLAQARIFFQQRQFNQFWKKFHSNLIQSSNLKMYIERLIQTLHRLALYQDYNYLAKMFHYVTSILINQKVNKDQNLNKIELPYESFVDLLKKVMQLKYDINWLQKNGNSKEVPIWYLATQQLIKVSFQYITNDLQQPCIKIYESLIKFIKSKKDISIEQCSIQCVSFFYENQIAVTNYLVDNYFYRGCKYAKNEDFQQILNSSLNESRNFDQKNPKNWSKNHYELLFKLSHKKQQEYSQNLFEKQSIVIKQLFVRILQTFNNFLNQSKQKQQADNNKMLLLQQQLKFILKKLLNLELKQQILQKINKFILINNSQITNHCLVLSLTKSHLFYFNSYFSKFIMYPDEDIRILIAEIYEIIGITLYKIQ